MGTDFTAVSDGQQLQDTAPAAAISLRVLIDKQRNKVVFAEAGSVFVDVLISFMTLPLGTVVRLLNKDFDGQQTLAIGSLNNLYASLTKLSSENFVSEEAKLMLLNPRNPFETECQKLKLNIDDTEPTRYYICENWSCSTAGDSTAVTTYNTVKCDCGSYMNNEIDLQVSDDQASCNKEGVFVTGTDPFMVTDDLQIIPLLAGAEIEKLKNLGVKDMSVLEEKTIAVTLKEVMLLLRLSLTSRTPLTDLILHNGLQGPNVTTTIKPEPDNLVPKNQSKTAERYMKMTLRVIVQKSTNKCLLAKADEKFAEFLFSILTTPLGGIESLLGGKTNVGSIDNLNKSISCLKSDGYFKSEDVKSSLLNPRIHPLYHCKSQILPLEKRPANDLAFHYDINLRYSHLYHGPPSDTTRCYSRKRNLKSLENPVIVKDPRGQQRFFRGPATFMVRDDLGVTQISAMTSISLFNSLGVPLDDVEEHAINIGIQEALSILKASLSSTSTLTNGLINLIPLKHPKQED